MTKMTVSGSGQKLPYPKSVFFIVCNEFCERFSYYGMKAVLILYLKFILHFNEDESTEIYHAFGMLCYFTPVLGAMLADSYLGKFKTIFYLSVVYAIGNIVLSLAATPPLAIPQRAFSMIGLLLIAFGTGGIKPCVSAFGGDQFKLPEQALQLASFFSVFYFSINAGSLISTGITPIFRKIQCFGADCYPLAFSVPAALMIVALVIFLFGKPFYKMNPPEGNVVMKVAKCIAHAIPRWIRKSDGYKSHWLDYADDKFDKKLIHDVKVILRIFVLYLPLPVFWALFDQQGSRWTFQATRMDGELFGGAISVLPDQMQIVNPLLILLLIPIFDQIIYPCLGKMGILTKSLQRLTLGGLLAGVAFVISGFLELKLQETYPVILQPNQSTFNFMNKVPCTILVGLKHSNEAQTVSNQHQILPNENFIFRSIQSTDYEVEFKSVDTRTKDFDCTNLQTLTKQMSARSKEATSLLISLTPEKTIKVTIPGTPDTNDKSETGHAFLRFVFATEDPDISKISLKSEKTNETPYTFSLVNDTNGFGTITKEVEPARYFVLLDNSDKPITTIHPRLGGAYIVSMVKNLTGNYEMNSFTTVEPNSLHMFWLLPQYIIITIAEVMFSVTGLEFSYSEAPQSMKSVIQAAWLLTVAFGNLIVLIIAGAKLFDEQWKEFFLFAGLMFVDMLVFMVLAYFYKSSKGIPEEEQAEESEMKSKNSKDSKGVDNAGFSSP